MTNWKRYRSLPEVVVCEIKESVRQGPSPIKPSPALRRSKARSEHLRHCRSHLNDVLNVVREASQLVVWANGEKLGAFPLTVTSIVVDARGGNDLVLVSHRVSIVAEIYSGSGNDRLIGGLGDNVLVNWLGND
jgi:hypothetical protein